MRIVFSTYNLFPYSSHASFLCLFPLQQNFFLKTQPGTHNKQHNSHCLKLFLLSNSTQKTFHVVNDFETKKNIVFEFRMSVGSQNMNSMCSLRTADFFNVPTFTNSYFTISTIIFLVLFEKLFLEIL